MARQRSVVALSVVTKALPIPALIADSADREGVLMGKVAAVYNVIPESPEVSVEQIMTDIPQKVPQGVEVATMNVKPFAFGLKIIEVTGIMEDQDGLIGKFEESLRSVPQVQGVNAVTITLV